MKTYNYIYLMVLLPLVLFYSCKNDVEKSATVARHFPVTQIEYGVIGQLHNDGLEYVLDQLDNENFSIFETPPQERYNKIRRYASEYVHNYMFQYYPDAQYEYEANIENIMPMNFSNDSLYEEGIYQYFIDTKYPNDMNLSYSAQYFLDEITQVILFGDNLYIENDLDDIISDCNILLNDSNEIAIISSSISVAKSSASFWRGNAYYDVLTRYISTESLPYIDGDIRIYSDNIDNTQNNDSCYQELVYADMKGAAEAAAGYIGTGIILMLPVSWEGLIVSTTLGAIIASADAVITQTTNDCLGFIDENNEFIWHEGMDGYEYLYSMHLLYPDDFYNLCYGKYIFMLNLFN